MRITQGQVRLQTVPASPRERFFPLGVTDRPPPPRPPPPASAATGKQKRLQPGGAACLPGRAASGRPDTVYRAGAGGPRLETAPPAG